jgi:hypothetical protein
MKFVVSTQKENNPMHSDQDSALEENRPTITGGGTAGAEDLGRHSTFSISFALSPEVYRRHFVQPFENMQQRLTEFGPVLGPESEYCNTFIDEPAAGSVKVNTESEGELPLQTGFARHSKFWKVAFLLILVAGFMGMVTAGFMNVAEEVG